LTARSLVAARSLSRRDVVEADHSEVFRNAELMTFAATIT
jgi:hypothetical protein